MHSDDSETPWYPRFVSDRADQLLDELDEGQVEQLRLELQTIPYTAWAQWLEDTRAAIQEYDSLPAAGRRRRLQGQDALVALRLHHACVFVELWRARLVAQHVALPPRGGPLDTPEEHRSMMLSVLASYSQVDVRDFWPFAGRPGSPYWPFADDA